MFGTLTFTDWCRTMELCTAICNLFCHLCILSIYHSSFTQMTASVLWWGDCLARHWGSSLYNSVSSISSSLIGCSQAINFGLKQVCTTQMPVCTCTPNRHEAHSTNAAIHVYESTVKQKNKYVPRFLVWFDQGLFICQRTVSEWTF